MTGGGGRDDCGVTGEGFPMTLIRWTLGALFIDQFFVNIHDGNYTSAGYSRLIHPYLGSASSPSVWQSVERFGAGPAARVPLRPAPP